jgi:hypothetical protein
MLWTDPSSARVFPPVGSPVFIPSSLTRDADPLLRALADISARCAREDAALLSSRTFLVSRPPTRKPRRHGADD